MDRNGLQFTISRSKSPGRKLTAKYIPKSQIVTRSQSAQRHSASMESVPNTLRVVKYDEESKPPPPQSNTCFNILVSTSLVVCLLISILLGLTSWQTQQWIKCQKLNSRGTMSPDLKKNLTLSLVGQEMIISAVIDGLNKFDTMSFNDVMVMWWVGPVGVGKSRLSKCLQDVPGAVLHKYHDSLLPHDTESLRLEGLLLFSQLDSCAPNIIILDGHESESSASLRFLNTFLSIINKCDQSCRTRSKTLIVLIGSYHSDVIMNSFVEHLKSEEDRSSYSKNFKKLYGSLRSSMLLSNNHDVTVIPFLPLEDYHLVSCIKMELENMFPDLKVPVDSNTIIPMFGKSIDDIVESVAKTTSYTESNKFLSKGCKRVNGQLKRELLNED